MQYFNAVKYFSYYKGFIIANTIIYRYNKLSVDMIIHCNECNSFTINALSTPGVLF